MSVGDLMLRALFGWLVVDLKYDMTFMLVMVCLVVIATVAMRMMIGFKMAAFSRCHKGLPTEETLKHKTMLDIKDRYETYQRH